MEDGQTAVSGTAERDPLSEMAAEVARERPYVHAAVVACGGSDLVDVGQIDYVAHRSGRDTEECVREAVEAREIELVNKDTNGYRMLDIYRVTPKGLREHRKHMRRVRRDADETGAWLRRVRAEFAAMDGKAARPPPPPTLPA